MTHEKLQPAPRRPYEVFGLTEKEALSHLGWIASLNGNKKLLEKVVQSVFKQVKDKYKEDKAMAFYLRDVQEKPNERALCLGRLDDGSDAIGIYGLYYYIARLVGGQ